MPGFVNGYELSSALDFSTAKSQGDGDKVSSAKQCRMSAACPSVRAFF